VPFVGARGGVILIILYIVRSLGYQLNETNT
jgi:hypothetical protein